MVQGAGLKKKTVIKAKPKGNAGVMRKGRVVKASKKHNTAKQHQLTKKLTASVTTSLEQSMAAKAGAVGKLTIMKDAQNKGKEAA
ncbi:hypothetical protein LPJ70_005119, partial [Coemansia sp. RSA 2708]